MKKTKTKALRGLATGLLTVFSVCWVYPVFMILMNSLKKESAISTSTVFDLPAAESFAGLKNYVEAIASQGFLGSLFYSLFITVTSVAAILLFCSMCAGISAA